MKNLKKFIITMMCAMMVFMAVPSMNASAKTVTKQTQKVYLHKDNKTNKVFLFDCKSLKVSSSNPAVVSVSNVKKVKSINGYTYKVTFRKPGKANIVASYKEYTGKKYVSKKDITTYKVYK